MQELARWLNPVAASPAAPRETVAALDAFGPVVDAADRDGCRVSRWGWGCSGRGRPPAWPSS